jgi:uncharacterized PurR-regulated membrane protein YhhQ (DUF165 family)
MLGVKISLYLGAFILSNFLVLWLGSKGLIITAIFLIPFDFVMRCMFHEQWKGKELILKLGALVFTASLITFLINQNSINIALGSMIAFASAQLLAGIFYQIFIKKSFFVKVNGSDAVGILIDSVIFQIIAFGVIDFNITISQFALKIIGGLFWYWIIFEKMKLYKK